MFSALYVSSLYIVYVFSSPPHPSSILSPYTTLFRSFPRNFAARGQGDFRPARVIHGWAESRLGCGLSRDDCVFSDAARSVEHTSELQSPCNLVCRLFLEKKYTETSRYIIIIMCYSSC